MLLVVMIFLVELTVQLYLFLLQSYELSNRTLSDFSDISKGCLYSLSFTFDLLQLSTFVLLAQVFRNQAFMQHLIFQIGIAKISLLIVPTCCILANNISGSSDTG